MTFLKRFGYFIVTSILVSVTIGFILNFLAYYFKINFLSGGYSGLFIFCLAWGMGGAFVSLQISRWSAKVFHGVQVIDPATHSPAERRLVDTVYRLARNAGLEAMPEVGIYESYDVNAFATGPSKKRALVAVSTGLLNTMSESELEGVLAHEIAHIANGDMVTMMLIQGVINAFAMFIAQLITMAIMSALRRDDDRRGLGDFFLRNFIYQVVSIGLMILGSVVVNYFSRQREFRADAGAARFASPEKMTSALVRLQRVYGRPQPGEGDGGPDKLATLKISGHASRLGRLFMTHPPLEERIAAIQNRTYSGAV